MICWSLQLHCRHAHAASFSELFVSLQDEEAFAKASADVESEIAGQAAELAALKVHFEKADKEVADLKKAAARIHKEGDVPACRSLFSSTVR